MKFKPVFVEGIDLNDTWFQLLYQLNEYGRRYRITEGSYKGHERLVFDDVAGFIHNPHVRPLAPILPEQSSLPRPTTDEDIEQYFAEYLMNSKLESTEHYRYSTFLVGGEYEMPILNGIKNFKINVPNQLEWIIKHFKDRGFGNEHCCITTSYPESSWAYDEPYINEQERKTSPCLRVMDFRVIEHVGVKYLHSKIYHRSQDLWGGWPVNLGGYTLVNEYVASELGIEPGPLSFSSKSLHAYDFQIDVLKARLGK